MLSFNLTTACLAFLSSCVQPNVWDRVDLGFIDFIILLSQGVLGDLLEGMFNIDGFLGAGLKIRDVIFGFTPALCSSLRNLEFEDKIMHIILSRLGGIMCMFGLCVCARTRIRVCLKHSN